MTIPTVAAELKQARKSYGRIAALRDVDLRIECGRITALLGPNGAGKTTAVRLLLGLASPDAGAATVFGGDPRRPATRTRLGAMLQVGKVPETLRVREHLDVFRSYYPAPLSLEAVVEIAGLGGLEDRLFGTLSGGQRQRVLFALALCGDPELLVLDEPTVGLDAASRRALWACIRRLRQEGRAVLLTTHYLEEADALADHVVLLSGGRVVAAGTPAEFKARIATRRVRCVTTLPIRTIERFVGGDPVRREGTVTEVLTGRAEEVVRELLWHDPALSGLEVVGAPLEEAFLELTGGGEERAGAASGDGTPRVGAAARAESGEPTASPQEVA